LPSQEATERNDASSKVVRLREAGHRFEAQIRKLERQFDARAKKLSEEFLSEVDQLNGEE
jgi:tRNA U34 5-methylaminomethyl-2-thiouridine-forming methyltransferase MnmC